MKTFRASPIKFENSKKFVQQIKCCFTSFLLNNFNELPYSFILDLFIKLD